MFLPWAVRHRTLGYRLLRLKSQPLANRKVSSVPRAEDGTEGKEEEKKALEVIGIWEGSKEPTRIQLQGTHTRRANVFRFLLLHFWSGMKPELLSVFCFFVFCHFLIRITPN